MSFQSNLNIPDDSVIVSLSVNPWAYPYWTSRQFLMYELSRYVQVLYTTERTYIREYGRLTYWKKLFSRKPDAPFDPPAGLELFEPDITPPLLYGYSGINKYSAKVFGKLLKKRCLRLGKKRIIAYVWDPQLLECLEGLVPDKIIYHPYDKFDLFESNEEVKQAILENERGVVAIADAVITPSTMIADYIKHPNIHVIHNGVFMPAFSNIYEHSENALLDTIPSPRVGYIGVINQKINFDLLLRVARSMTTWSFVLIGPIKQQVWQREKYARFEEFKSLPNVHFFSPVIFSKVPSLMIQIDVGIVPYDLTTNAGYTESPLKVYQYWAAGKPIVSVVPLPNIENKPGILSVAATPEEWIKAIELEIENNSQTLEEKRRKLAIENSWSVRAEQVLEVIRQLYAEDNAVIKEKITSERNTC